MKVIVCIKQVPEVTEIRFDAQRRVLVRDGVRLQVNPFDRPAIAQAVQLKQQRGAETLAVTMGPPQAESALREALAAGIDRAVHLCDPAFAGSDTLATARTLAALCQREGFDLILCGKYTVDGETAQVGPELAELLDVPQITGVSQLTLSEDGRTLRARRETDEGHDEVEAPLPCLITAAEHLLPPIAVRKPALDQAQSAPLARLGAADLGLAAERCGAAGSPTWVAEIQELAAPPRPAVEWLGGATEQVAEELARVLRRCLREAARPAPPPLPVQRSLPAGARAIWVVAEWAAGDGALSPGTQELLGEAAQLAEELQGAVVAVGVGDCPAALPAACARAGADRVLQLAHEALRDYSSEGHAAALCQAIQHDQPEVVLFSSTERGRDLAPRVAARLGLGLTGDAVGLALDGEGRLVQRKPAFGGNVVAPILSRTRPQMATVRPGVFALRAPAPDRAAAPEVRQLAEPPRVRARLLRSEISVDQSALALGGARVVVGVGMGAADALPALRELAGVLGAALCATRRVTDKGLLPRQQQVGLTGKVIAPDLYLAVGVRGVPNHTIGVQRAGTIIAINKDEKAPIFQMARYGAVADCAVLVPALSAALARTTEF